MFRQDCVLSKLLLLFSDMTYCRKLGHKASSRPLLASDRERIEYGVSKLMHRSVYCTADQCKFLVARS